MNNLEARVSPKKCTIQEGQNGTKILMFSLLDAAKNDFTLSVVDETKHQAIPMYNLEGHMGSRANPVFALYKAYKEGKIQHRFAFVQYNKDDFFTYGTQFFVDCKTGMIAKKEHFMKLINNPAIRNDILTGKLSTDNLERNCITELHGGRLVPKQYDTLLKCAEIDLQESSDGKAYDPAGHYRLNGENFYKLIRAIDYVYKLGNGPVEGAIQGINLKWIDPTEKK